MINKIRAAEEFIKLVSIDAPSFKEREMADVLKQYLVGLGFEVTEDDAYKFYGGNAGNLYGFLKGDIKGDPLLFSAHMDTVEPSTGKKAMIQEDGTITSDGSTVLGADDLAGVVAILEAVRTIREKGLSHRSVEVLFTIAEEVYIRGSEVFDYNQIKAKEAYVLDLSGPVGTAALKAPTLVSFTSEFTGKASHAGFAPEEGINAISAAAEAITAMKQGRIDEETTVNVGIIEGGLARNIVPEKCILKGEVRSLNHNKTLAEIDKIEHIFKETAWSFGAELKFETSFGCIAYEIDKAQEVVKRFDRACRELGYETDYVATFGGSDNNNFVRNGITGIVIACGMNAVHSTKEYTHIDELERCSNITLKLMT
ncbi:M20/M25/M40 family metallo-hydrolase [Anaerocolumna sp. MB42-C2]|uniref:M20/M25/M40 family metallo-hydrolase n=1 Tax=Anaerocolumna sp. MB42-C2 TaxID=3070997 RepID=UPI0027E0FCD4|nr:M20/M25/M40 family metallo-hydrolase [Anaerocolumna sp. MB42-C2]WMJ89904.1 M20/M25/M40 family metallo-hydrolase [Anaerocolumna sp. MB42-C2]